MKVYLDDVRDCPPGWEIARSARTAMELLLRGDVTHISLDYDLGQEFEAGAVIFKARERYDAPDGSMVMFFIRQFRDWMFPMPVVKFHTANPEGLKKMQAILRDIERGYR